MKYFFVFFWAQDKLTPSTKPGDERRFGQVQHNVDSVVQCTEDSLLEPIK